MAKRKTRSKSKTSSKRLLYIAAILAIVVLVVATLFVGFYLGQEKSKSEALQKSRLAQEKQQKQATKQEPQKSVNERLYELLQKESKDLNETATPSLQEPKLLPPIEQTQGSKTTEADHNTSHKSQEDKQPKVDLSASHEIDDDLPEKLENHKRERVKSSHRPKLCIIIDDVATKKQVQAIKGLNMPLVLSFLPPSKGRGGTPTLAANEERYMVHLPMEAQKFSAEEPHTLHVNDSQEKILQRVAEIKRLFPKVKFVNNHTGSKFTANEVAMKRLFNALGQNGMAFVDSRTTGQTKAPKVAKIFGVPYLGRDIFLDHHMDKPYILSQIRKAIKSAKIHGSAIAIGHPHKNTLQALRESKRALQEVELVFIDKL